MKRCDVMKKNQLYIQNYRDLIIIDLIGYIGSIIFIIFLKQSLLDPFEVWGYSKGKTLFYFILLHFNLFLCSIMSVLNYKYLLKNNLVKQSHKKWLLIILPSLTAPIIGVLFGIFVK